MDIKVTDYGCLSEESVDYPDFAHALSEGIINSDIGWVIFPKIVLYKPEMSTFENMLEFKNINKVF